MKICETELAGAFIIDVDYAADARGGFAFQPYSVQGADEPRAGRGSAR